MLCYPKFISHFFTSHKEKVKGISTYKEICRHRGILANTKLRPVMVTKAQSWIEFKNNILYIFLKCHFLSKNEII